MFKFAAVFSVKNNVRASLNGGFTLAEVLLTLGIIGIVATMTIPTLINNFETTQYRVALKKAYSAISQAHMQVLNENATPYAYPTNYASALSKYFKINVKCQTPTAGCWYSANNWYSLANTPLPALADQTDVFKLSDGMTVVVLNSGHNVSGTRVPILTFNLGAKDYGDIFVDVNGDKKPNRVGYDIYFFEYYGNGIFPAGSTKSSISGSSYCDKNNLEPSYIDGVGCTSLALSGESY